MWLSTAQRSLQHPFHFLTTQNALPSMRMALSHSKRNLRLTFIKWLRSTNRWLLQQELLLVLQMAPKVSCFSAWTLKRPTARVRHLILSPHQRRYRWWIVKCWFPPTNISRARFLQQKPSRTMAKHRSPFPTILQRTTMWGWVRAATWMEWLSAPQMPTRTSNSIRSTR